MVKAGTNIGARLCEAFFNAEPPMYVATGTQIANASDNQNEREREGSVYGPFHRVSVVRAKYMAS
jgi:hypothetical protein